MMVLGSSTVVGAEPEGGCTCDADIAAAGSAACGPNDGFGDGFVNADDLNLLLECATGTNFSCVGGCGDVNCDGLVNLVDVATVFCQVNGMCGAGECTTQLFGACCFPILGCLISTQELCEIPGQANPVIPGGGTYLGDGFLCNPNQCDCNGNGVFDDIDIASGTSADCNFTDVPDECELFACCGPEQGTCFDATRAVCDAQFGFWQGGTCLKCPEQNAAVVEEPGGPITHVIGPPVDCPLSPGSSAKAEGPCTPGQFIDAWVSPANGMMCHQFGVAGSPAIMADFFAPGSAPFTGSVCLQGVPLGVTPFGVFGDADTLVRRTSDPFDRCQLSPVTADPIPLELVALSLESVSPIMVIVNGQPEAWDVFVDLSDTPAPLGSLTATKTHCNGGTYTSLLNVLPRFTFTKVADPTQVRVLDTGLEGLPPIILDQNTPAPWVHDVDPPFDMHLDPCSHFHTGFEQCGLAPLPPCDFDCDCDGNTRWDRCDLEECAGNPSCLDCNGNGVQDGCNIASGSSRDCNSNALPDDCEIASDPSLDADGDGILDGCIPPIPTVSAWGVVVMTLLLLSSATIVFRKRSTVTA